MSKSRVFAPTCLLILLTLGLEIILRTIFGLGTPILIQRDEASGYILKPNQNVRRFFVHTIVNRYGMRSAEFTPRKPSNVIRLMFLGDSITYGTAHVDQANIFSEIVRKDIQSRTSRQVELLNASAGSWAIGNELGYVQSRGAFESDLIAVIINRGDLSQRFATVADVGENLLTAMPASAISELVSRTYARLKNIHKMDEGIADYDESPGRVLPNIEKLTEIHRVAESQQARMVLVYLPLRRDLKRDQPCSMPEVLLSWSKHENVATLDLTGPEAKFPENEIEASDHAHFNDLGNRVIAKPLGEFLLKELYKRKDGTLAGQSGPSAVSSKAGA